MSESDLLIALRQQQAALAEFGTFAFWEEDISKILAEAARVCATCLAVPYAKICTYRAAQNDLLVVAGYGWQEGVVGCVVSQANESSTQGRAFVTGEPVILANIDQNNSYALPAFYHNHDIVSTADVLIKGADGPWGVLEVDSPKEREFDEQDVVFLSGFANVVAEAVMATKRAGAMQASLEKMRVLIVERDALLVDRTKREFKLHELQAELLHVSRLNAMGQMTAAIAHELNQPLAAMANYVSAAKLTLDLPDLDPEALGRAKEMIDKALNQTLRAGNIIRNLKDMVEKRESQRVGEDLGATVKDALALVLFGATEAYVSVNFDIDATVPYVLVDKIQIQQILINLIRNSIEAMRGSTERTLTLTTAMGDDGFANVTVRDTGSGLPSSVSSRLFQPFMTTKSSGMGLGLMICQTLVEANGGRIWLVKDNSAGTAFAFSLPLLDVATDAEPVKPLAA